MTGVNTNYRCPHCGTTVTVEPGQTNQLLTCPAPNCHKPFRVEAPAAKIIVPPELNNPPRLQNGPPPAAAEAPEAEAELQKLHPDMVRRYPLRCLGYALLGVAGLTIAIWSAFEGWWFLILVGLAIAGFGAYRLVAWWLRMQNTTLTLTNKRFILETGVLAKHKTEVPLENVADVQVFHEPLTDLLQVGDLVVLTKSGENKRLVLLGVPNPEQVAAQFRHEEPVAQATVATAEPR